MIHKTYIFLFVQTAILTGCFSANAQTPAPLIKPETTANQNLKVFDALWEKVNTKYFDPNFNGVNWSHVKQVYRPKAETAATKQDLLIILRQMLAELKTSHLYVWPTFSENKVESRIGSDIDRKRDTLQLGYGFGFRIIEGKPIVTEIEPNASAKFNGVKAGWTLVSVNDVRLTDLPNGLGDVNERERSSFLFVDAEKQEHRLTLTAEWMVKKPVRIGRLLSGKIAYVKFDGFIAGTANWLHEELRKFNSPAGIIVDLRGNRGGYVQEVKNYLGQFFAEDTELGTFIERGGKIKETKVNGKKDSSFKGKIVVLVDDQSTSGAEIFAQLIKENRRGKIVGTQTKGEVLNGAEYGLPGDFRTSIAFRDYLSPTGERLEGKGVMPDIEVPLTIEDIVRERDMALEKALELIK